MKNSFSIRIVLSVFLLLCVSCGKQNEWLDKKMQNRDVLPSSIKDYQAMLDNTGWMNTAGPGLGILGCDNYYITYNVWQAATLLTERNGYLWNSQVFEGESSGDWNRLYTRIAYANIVLEGLQEISPSQAEQEQWNYTRGNALFYRANAFFELAQLFAPPYNAATAASDKGIILKLTSDIHEKIGRASVKDTYEKILADFRAAAELLPVVPEYKTRPSRPVAYHMLARVLLHTGDAENALSYARKAVALYGELVDYNMLDSTIAFPFPGFPFNSEVIFYSETSTYGITSFRGNRALVDTALYHSYHTDDLRRVIFYTSPDASGGIWFKGQYTGLTGFFGGIAANELYMVKAEAAARAQQKDTAMATLNTLMEKRWRRGRFVSLTAATAEEALGIIISERRKEFPFTGILPWEDLRRLNREPRFARSIRRVLNNISYILPPNDPRYVYPIPDNEISINNIEQNER